MRSMRVMRTLRPMHVAVGLTMLAIPGAAAALSTGRADPQSGLQIETSARQLTYGSDLTVRGAASVDAAGRPVTLEYASAGDGHWRSLRTATIDRAGHFTLVAGVPMTGLVRAVTTSSANVTPDLAAVAGPPASSASNPRAITVAAKFSLRERAVVTLSGRSIRVDGRLLPAVSGRTVRLQERRGGAWQTLATERTGPRGGFTVRYAAKGLAGAEGRRLRVQFAGDRSNSRSSALAGRLTAFRESLASWYDDAGSTACGFHAGLSVANKVLPCGTRVAFRHGGKTVTAVVDDRGPYVGAREWDFNQNTAGALAFDGVGTVWSTS